MYFESGDVEVSNNISEQSVRKLKMNLRNAGNIGSESSAVDNAMRELKTGTTARRTRYRHLS